ncbi:hypothetical protein SKAU_G00307740 [Synaphobranchus kaupii]|uniref:Tumor protein p53-inducible protein 11 n=1 Tax=Synaphobranchus kaupii TaxID=118154 RepID=A0A9Q1ER35_SYNKA|nr:hypothetical protein SKAU_G00307740 [Synaphobranchus kaupii]
MASKPQPPLMKKHSQTDLISRLKTRKILGVGGEDDDGEVHRSKISQMLGNEIKFAVREPVGLRVWILISAIVFTSMALMALVFPNQLYEVVFDKELSATSISIRLYGGALLSISLIMWNGLYTVEKIIIQWTLLTEACYFAVQFLVTSITLLEIGSVSNAAIVLLLSRTALPRRQPLVLLPSGTEAQEDLRGCGCIQGGGGAGRGLEVEGTGAMGKGCITATKYFLFLFNLLFFIFGALILGFGLWVLLDNQSLITVLQESSTSLKVGSYILIGVGSMSMLMGFLGCIGAVYEIRCLLGLYFICLLLILISQVTAAVLIYFQRDLLKTEMSSIVNKIIVDYNGQNSSTTEVSWDYIQRTIHCCGWTGPGNWTENILIKNSSQYLYPCSCRNVSQPGDAIQESGFCNAPSLNWPVYNTGCMVSVENWILSNSGVILGISIGVAVIELLGIILAVCLCKSIHQEDYTKVPKY